MKIAQLVSNYHKVSPLANNAIYSHVAWLTNGLVGSGHDTTLFATGNSETKGRLESVTDKEVSKMKCLESIKKHYLHLLVSKCYQRADQFDIIHSHFNLLSSFYSDLIETPTVQSIHSPIESNLMPVIKKFKKNRYISFSLAQRKSMPDMNWIGNIYHGVDIKKFAFNPAPQDYFLYLGRITKEKGVHYAIEAAKAAGVPLIMAGRSYPAEGYWHDKIEKQIDGKKIQYVGEANFKDKIEYLKNAKALLFPTQYDEVFGYVMIEAMSCGTPVIGWNKGSVPEVVSNEKTGFVIDNIPDMVKAVKAIDQISREQTRQRVETYFSIKKMVSGYEKIYARVIEECKFRERNGKK